MQQNSSIPVQPEDATQPITSSDNAKKTSSIRGILSTVAILIAAPMIALMLTAFVFQSYEVDGPSMETTLQNHDRLIVWKLPKTVAKITHRDYIPHRGDIIIFVKHDLYEANGTQEKQLIKRVIGLPGDRVVVQNDHITIYNTEHPEGFNPDINHDYSGHIASVTSGNIDLLIPEGQVFVDGDNRPNSLDSRAFGPIPAGDIVGKLKLRIFPVNNFKSFM